VSELVYERRGAGEPLVLLHGIGAHWRTWEPVLDRLATAHDVIAIDLPGFGESPLPAGGPPADMAALAATVAAFFTKLGLGRPHVVGNSLGGGLALELAAAGLVSSATALSPVGFCTPARMWWALRVLSAHRLAARLPQPVLRTAFGSAPMRTLTLGMVFGRPGRLSLDMALADARALRDAPAFDVCARAGRGYAFTGSPTVPVTVAWGTRDRVLPYRQAALARERLPQARHVDLPGCGHVPMNDDPDLVTSVILDTSDGADAAGLPDRADTSRPIR
jgi:pimeloyl-ACP methyl ester carboxylesterase